MFVPGSLDGSDTSDLVKSVEDLEDRVSRSKGKVIEAITPAKDIDKKASVKRTLDDLGNVTSDLVSAVKSHAGMVQMDCKYQSGFGSDSKLSSKLSILHKCKPNIV